MWDLIVGEEEEEDVIKWSPRISVSDLQHNGMRVHFDPPYPGAAYHYICASKEDYFAFCVKKFFEVTMPSVSQFIEVPNNRTYRIMVRPLDSAGKYLYRYWMPAHLPVFLPPYDTEISTIDIPVETPVSNNNITEISSIQSEFISQPSNIAIIVSLIVVILAILGFILYKCQKRRRRRNIYKVERLREVTTDSVPRGPVTITPLYLHDSSELVEDHLDILNSLSAIIIDRIDVENLNGNLDQWINKQIQSVLNSNHHYILIYASDDLKQSFREPDKVMEREKDQLCVKFIQKICENRKIKPYVVCFGDQSDLKTCLPLTLCHDVLSVVDKDDKDDNSVSFVGTEELIARILSIEDRRLVTLHSSVKLPLQERFLQLRQVSA